MLCRLARPILVNLRVLLSVLPVVAIAVAGAALHVQHTVLPAGSNWG